MGKLHESMEYDFIDGSEEEVIEAAEKEKEDHEKEVEKDLKAKEKIVDEINEAEPEDFELIDGAGHKLKSLKQIIEETKVADTKLILSEELDESDYFDFEHAAYNALVNVIRKFIYKGISKDDVYQVLTSIEYHFEDDDEFDDLDEELDEADYFDFEHAAYGAFINVVRKFIYKGISKDDVYRALESIEQHFESDDEFDDLDEALNESSSDFIFELADIVSEADLSIEELLTDIANNGGEEVIINVLNNYKDYIGESLTEDALNEAVPKDLLQAYKKSQNSVANRGREGTYGAIGNKNQKVLFDFQNSEYTPITPEEAMQYKKAGQLSKLRIIFNNQLVMFTDEGKPMYKASRDNVGGSYDHRSYSDRNALFTVPGNQKVADWSTQLPFSAVLNRADKIYVADEKDPGEKQSARATNPESRYYRGSFEANGDLRGYRNSKHTMSDYDREYDYYERQLKYAKQKLASDERRFKDEPEQANYWNDIIKSDQEDVYYYQKLVNNKKLKMKDDAAIRRYAASASDLRQTFNNYKEIKSDLRNIQYDINRASDDLNRIKDQGASDATIRIKKEIEDYKAKIKQLQKALDLSEIRLENADEDDAKAIADAQKRFDDINAQAQSYKDQIDVLLRRNR